MDRLTAMGVFKRVVELSSFSAAARDLSLSNAAVSKNVSELEAHLGVRLLNRTTRRLSITEAGDAYYRRCVAVLEEIDAADREASTLAATPRGLLRVSAPMSLGLLHLAAAVPAFLRRYPDISVDLVLDDRVADLVHDGFDLALRGGAPLSDSSLACRRLAAIDRVVCAHPDYFAAHGTPAAPDDLTDHQCLIYSLSSTPRDWRFQGPGGETAVRVTGRFTANSSIALREALLDRLGIALIPTFVVGSDLKHGRLVPALPDWLPEDQSVYAVYPHRRFVSAKVRCFIDFLVERFSTPGGWAAAHAESGHSAAS